MPQTQSICCMLLTNYNCVLKLCRLCAAARHLSVSRNLRSGDKRDQPRALEATLADIFRRMAERNPHHQDFPHGGHRSSGGGGGGRKRLSHRQNNSHDYYAHDDTEVEGHHLQRPRHPVPQQHPPHLRGRDIGMFYAQRSRQRTAQHEVTQAPELTQLSGAAAVRLQQLLGVLPPVVVTDDSAAAATTDSTMRARSPAVRDPQLDAVLLDELRAREAAMSAGIARSRERLPVWQDRERLLKAMEAPDHQVLVLSGPTGCGKSTQMPQLLLDRGIAQGRGSLTRVVVTQPRRIAVISLAERVAEERGEQVGGASVGYQVRLEKQLAQRAAGSVTYCTVGVLLRWLLTDRTLAGVSHLVVDEVHERSADTDLLLTELKRTILPYRPDLKLLLMSATIDAEQLATYFDAAFGCSRAAVEGRLFPVRSHLLEDCLRLSGFRLDDGQLATLANRSQQAFVNRLRSADSLVTREARGRAIEQRKQARAAASAALKRRAGDSGGSSGFDANAAADLLEAIGCEEPPVELLSHMVRYVHTQQPPGAVLVFVPGMKHIKDLVRMLSSDPACSRCHLLPLHSRLPSSAQRQVFQAAPKGYRKVVLATNIAETSITIDDVVYVIDSGFAKLSAYHHVAMSDSLAASKISRANARQREGRAGRVQPGVCYHLYSGFAESRMPERLSPEVLRLRLEDFLLQVKLLNPGVPVVDFLADMPDPPPAEHVRQARQTLLELGALTPAEDLSPLGRHIARLPLPCQLAKMTLLGACFSCLEPVLTIAAALSHRSPFESPLGEEKAVQKCKERLAQGCQSDHLLLWLAYSGWRSAQRDGLGAQFARANYLSPVILQALTELKLQLADQLSDYMMVRQLAPDNPALNRNSHRLELIRAVVTAGLYPNIVMSKPAKRVTSARGRPGEPRYELPADTVVHDQSPRQQQRQHHRGDPEPVWLAYFDKCLLDDRRAVSIFDATLMRPIHLLFCCSNARYRQEMGRDLAVLDNWIKLAASRDTFDTMAELRFRLDTLLAELIQQPGKCLQLWSHELMGPAAGGSRSLDVCLLNAIADLLDAPPADYPD